MDTFSQSTHIPENMSIDGLTKQIRAIEDLDRRSSPFHIIQQYVNAIFSDYSCLTRIIESKQSWRARKNIGEGLFNHVNELWYPKPEYVKEFGRMNQPEKPVFYISASHQTAMLEVRANPGDLVTILEMSLKTATDLPHVMEIGVAEKTSQYNLPTSVTLLENTPAGRAFLGSGVTKNLMIRSFLAREVTRVVDPADAHLFKVSAAIYDQLTSSDRIDGVEYPSIAGDGSASKGGTNLALKLASADRLFKPTGCFVLRIIDCVLQPTPGLLIKCVKVATGILPDGSIKWN